MELEYAIRRIRHAGFAALFGFVGQEENVAPLTREEMGGLWPPCLGDGGCWKLKGKNRSRAGTDVVGACRMRLNRKHYHLVVLMAVVTMGGNWLLLLRRKFGLCPLVGVFAGQLDAAMQRMNQ